MSIKMDKVRNYNQILLALAGTIGVVFLIVTSIIIIGKLLPRDIQEGGMITNEEVVELRKQEIRKELVSFKKILVVDSVKQVFVMPVTQASLSEPESYDSSLGLLNKTSGGTYRGAYRDLIYNNLVVCYGEENSTEIVFKERLSIGAYLLMKQGAKDYIIATGCINDSNSDSFLNGKDIQSLFVYDIANKKLSQVDIPLNYTTLRVYRPKKMADTICSFGVDRDSSGSFDIKNEPTVLLKLDLDLAKINHIVGDESIVRLQGILEGK